MRPTDPVTALALLMLACAAPPPVAPPAVPVPATTSAPHAAAAAPSQAPVADGRPTERTPEARARDAARAPLASAIVDAYGNYSPKFSPDGKHVLFASKRDGNRQYYLAEVARPTAPPVAITHGPERAAGAIFARGGRSILFARDTGADENYRIFEVGLDGRDERCLTPGRALRRSMPIAPDGARRSIVYWQRDPRSSATEIVVQSLSGDPRVVYTDPSPATLPGVTRDGTRALVLRRYSSSDYILLELDLRSGKTRRLYPSEGVKAAIHGATYAADGKRVFVATDGGGDGEFLLALDTATASVLRTYRQTEPSTARIDTVIASPGGDRIAVAIDMGDHVESRILDAKTLEGRATVKSPEGDLSLTGFSTDGSKFGATISTSDAPPDVYSIETATGDVRPLRADVRPGLEALAPTDASIEAVPAFDGLSIPVLVHLPRGARSLPGRLPVIVEFHGGPADSAALGWNTFARFFTALGYAYVEPNVRGSTGYGRAYEMADNRERREDWLKDLACVNAWTRAQAWADPDRIVAMGGSYGGYSVLMALTRQPPLWRSGVEYVGISNLQTLLKSTSQWLRAVWIDEFGDLEKDAALLERFSPIRDVDKIVAPLYVYAGQNDPRVPREESDQIVVALRARGVPVEYQVATNEGHSLDHRENRTEFMTRVARFLEDHAAAPRATP